MDIERTLETQRHRLLRIVAGLIVVIGVLAVGPVSRRFSDWTLGFVVSVLSRAEAAARFMLITQACLIISRNGLDLDRHRISEVLAPDMRGNETGMSLFECQKRLKILHIILRDLPRCALRLIRRMEKLLRHSSKAGQSSPRLDQDSLALSGDDALPANRIERPPDKSSLVSLSKVPLPEYRAGGRGGFAVV